MPEEEILKQIQSLCPECLEIIPADIYVDPKRGDGKGWVMLRKQCQKHGQFQDIIAKNVEWYKWNTNFAKEIGSVDNITTKFDPACTKKSKKGCPFDCGPCSNHQSSPCILVLDVTNRCNLMCPICFANANHAGHIVEPTFDELVTIMEHFRSLKPSPPPLFQVSGGEPTLHPDLPGILRKAKELGFIETLVNTNGIRMSKSVEYFQELIDAGLDAVYLQFDGTTPETYKKVRGANIWPVKKKFIENARACGFKGVMLVPTVARGVNDHEIGNILDFARENKDVVSGIVYQPVSLCGRISYEDLMEMRYTISDLTDAIAKHTNNTVGTFYPLASTAKLTRLIAWFDDEPWFSMLSHEDCGFATFAPIENGEFTPIEKYFDVAGILKWANQVYDMVQKREIPKISSVIPVKIMEYTGKIGKIVAEFTDRMTDLAYRQAMKTYFLAGAARFVKDPINFLKPGTTLNSFLKVVGRAGLDSAEGFLQSNNLFIACMHFQDAFNFNLDRVSHCLVHYGVMDPDDPTRKKVLEIPFCAMNTLHREGIEKKLAHKPLEKTPDQVQKEIEEYVTQLEGAGKK